MSKAKAPAGTDVSVKKNITLPQSYMARLEAIKLARGALTDSEAIRDMIKIAEYLVELSKKDENLYVGDLEKGDLRKLELL
jgi:Ribbon-helix-helix protein, copG family